MNVSLSSLVAVNISSKTNLCLRRARFASLQLALRALPDEPVRPGMAPVAVPEYESGI